MGLVNNVSVHCDINRRRVMIDREGVDYMESVTLYPGELEAVIDQLSHAKWLLEQSAPPLAVSGLGVDWDEEGDVNGN